MHSVQRYYHYSSIQHSNEDTDAYVADLFPPTTPGTVVECVPSCCCDARAARYAVTTAGEHFRSVLGGSYKRPGADLKPSKPGSNERSSAGAAGRTGSTGTGAPASPPASANPTTGKSPRLLRRHLMSAWVLSYLAFVGVLYAFAANYYTRGLQAAMAAMGKVAVVYMASVGILLLVIIDNLPEPRQGILTGVKAPYSGYAAVFVASIAIVTVWFVNVDMSNE